MSRDGFVPVVPNDAAAVAASLEVNTCDGKRRCGGAYPVSQCVCGIVCIVNVDGVAVVMLTRHTNATKLSIFSMIKMGVRPLDAACAHVA